MATRVVCPANCRLSGSKVEWPCVRTICIRLGHESLGVTLAYLKGKDAESEEAQEHANSSSLALYA
jgi:hypothetical protein